MIPPPAKKKALARSKKKKQPARPRPIAAKEKPLPPPVEVPAAQPSQGNDPFSLDAILSQRQGEVDSLPASVPFSISTEPAPGEPLSEEAERVLSDVTESGDQDEPGDSLPPAGELLPNINFNETKVKLYLEESFEWLALKFESDHWKLSATQSDMLAGPTAELLGGVWSKLAVMLPDALTSVPGATAFLLAFSFVVVPKAAQQMAISRARKQGANIRRPGGQPGPVPVRPRPTEAVGPMNDSPVQPMEVS